LALNIFISEITKNQSFINWFSEYPTITSVFTLFSALDIQLLNTLSSDLFGLKIFSVQLTKRSRKIMFWGSIINIFIKDIPQFIIQGLYYNRVINYDLIPSLTLASSGLMIVNKLISSLYHTLVRWHNQRNKIRNSNDSNRRLSIASFRSVMSNVENYNNNLTENVSFESIRSSYSFTI
jgi:hypothetical protein